MKEEFLDLPVALSGGGSLENRLKESFVDMELLEGRNQYRCEECKTLVDAKKVDNTPLLQHTHTDTHTHTHTHTHTPIIIMCNRTRCGPRNLHASSPLSPPSPLPT